MIEHMDRFYMPLPVINYSFHKPVPVRADQVPLDNQKPWGVKVSKKLKNKIDFQNLTLKMFGLASMVKMMHLNQM